MNRYKSSQRWRKVKRGWYADREGHYYAVRFPTTGARTEWLLYGGSDRLGTFLTLADCQEHADRLERSC